jgi:hypothetical protein
MRQRIAGLSTKADSIKETAMVSLKDTGSIREYTVVVCTLSHITLSRTQDRQRSRVLC